MATAESERMVWNLMLEEAGKLGDQLGSVRGEATTLGDAWEAEITSKISIPPLSEKFISTQSGEPAKEPGAEETPSNEEILADLADALAEDANKAIEETEEQLFEYITKQLWSEVKSGLEEELKSQKFTGGPAEIEEALKAAAFNALSAA
ncbi:MAG: hypothetical protein ACRD3O_17605, partial [Terriglobia bacterium]